MENRKCRQNVCLLLVTEVRGSTDRFLKIDHCVLTIFRFNENFMKLKQHVLYLQSLI